MKQILLKYKKTVTIIKLIAYTIPFILTLYYFLKIKWYDFQIEKKRTQYIENRKIKLINFKFLKDEKMIQTIIIKKNQIPTKSYYCSPIVGKEYISCIKNKNEDILSIAYTNNHVTCAIMYTFEGLNKIPMTDESFRSHCPTFFRTYFYQLPKIITWEYTIRTENTDLRSGALIWILYFKIFQTHPMKVFYEETNDGIIALTHDLYGGSQLIYIYFNGQVFNVKFKNQLFPEEPLPIDFKTFKDNRSTDSDMFHKFKEELF
ncbi:hypothetical protein ND860_18480 [Leptospira levettii]|uniref:hypothetical protein n=1 Tax=Leptospira levettii TaxID=2023178 RepID=UPI00223CDE26|nr:hypothetical protein [Leptospira levettii]MCW7498528.1 hypothetical protein [Leptospira levettii]